MLNNEVAVEICRLVFIEAKKKANGVMALSRMLGVSNTAFHYSVVQGRTICVTNFLNMINYIGKERADFLIGGLLESMTLNPSNFNTKIAKKLDSRLKIRQKRAGTKKNDSFKGNDDESAKAPKLPRNSKPNRIANQRA